MVRTHTRGFRGRDQGAAVSPAAAGPVNEATSTARPLFFLFFNWRRLPVAEMIFSRRTRDRRSLTHTDSGRIRAIRGSRNSRYRIDLLPSGLIDSAFTGQCPIKPYTLMRR